MPGTNMNVAGTQILLSSPTLAMSVASSSVTGNVLGLPQRCWGRNIRTGFWWCLWKAKTASMFRHHLVLLRGVTTVMPLPHGMARPSWKHRLLRSSMSNSSCCPCRIRVSSRCSSGSPAARTCSVSITTVVNRVQSACALISSAILRADHGASGDPACSPRQ
ncbi:hypothetical protein B0T10DRAFT_279930 [Thelonectria olida]|uniref:Uncharacterized protein n=1 Tax=Thelonectria olida TaxID=1576542 RepID=A0A9P9AI20_9HYPO|nr:hypothetical protein B0T10DRAFT_279930 [Thelonectria olida]